MSRTFRSARHALLAALALGSFASCAKKELEVNCGPSDQHAAYMNPLNAGATTVITVDSAFSNDEYQKLLAAVETWNVYGRSNFGRNLFSVTQSVGALAATSTVPVSTGDCGFPGAGNAFSVVKIDDNARWRSLGMGTNNPGVTVRCAASGEFVARQVVLLNPNNTTIDQIQSVFVHELGHAIGLDHSCADGAGGPGYVGCSALGTNHSYRAAVMYPILYLNPVHPETAEIKEALNGNDEERASCILGYNPDN